MLHKTPRRFDAARLGAIRQKIRKVKMARPVVSPAVKSLLTRGYRYALHLPLTPWQPLEKTPDYPWWKDAARGQAMRSGTFQLINHTENYDQKFLQDLPQKDSGWQREWYDFHWLHDLLADAPEKEAADYARRIIADWYSLHRLERVSQQAEVVAARLVHWLYLDKLLLQDADRIFCKFFRKTQVESVMRLERCRAAQKQKTPLIVLKALIFAGLYLPGAHYLLNHSLTSLQQVLDRLFLQDGGHHSRNPEQHLTATRDLLEIIHLLRASHMPVEESIYAIAYEALNVLSMLGHADQRLALFNGATAQPFAELLALWRHWQQPELTPKSQLPEMGFVRLDMGQTHVMMDVGAPDPQQNMPHQGTLSFEMSDEQERLLVNCGDYRGVSTSWKGVCQQPAAHTLLLFDDAEIASSQRAQVTYQRERRGEEFMLESAYNGYVASTGLVHYRRLSLMDDGARLQGLDVLARQGSEVSVQDFSVTLRFHLHPKVEIIRQNRGMIDMVLPSGKQWRFITAKEYAAHVEDSVYLGEGGKPQPSRQLAMRLTISNEKGHQIKWRLERKG
jgi:uncharacterized heparinase superfamily protein